MKKIILLILVFLSVPTFGQNTEEKEKGKFFKAIYKDFLS